MSYTAHQVVSHYQQRKQQALESIQQHQALLDELTAQIDALKPLVEGAWRTLAQAYLPKLSQPDLERAQQLTGFGGFKRRDPMKALQRAIDVRRGTVAKVLTDERYQRRVWLVGPSGELTRALEEARSLLDPWQRDCARFEDLPQFQELIEANYDTPEYDVSFISARYWRLWKAGDAVCEALGMDDFGDDVLPAYAKVVRERHKWLGEVRRAEGQVDAVHELVRRHDTALAELPRLPEKILGDCVLALSKHLEHADPGLLEEWLGEEPERELLIALRRAAGLKAKRDMLKEMANTGIKGLLDSLRKRRAKYTRKAEKYARGKYIGQRFAETDLDPGFDAKLVKLEKEHRRTVDLVSRLMAYDRYDRFALSNEPDLWWVEMTGKRPSRYTPGLRSWYSKNPRAVPEREVRDSEPLLGVAMAARGLDEADYLS